MQNENIIDFLNGTEEIVQTGSANALAKRDSNTSVMIYPNKEVRFYKGVFNKILSPSTMSKISKDINDLVLATATSYYAQSGAEDFSLSIAFDEIAAKLNFTSQKNIYRALRKYVSESKDYGIGSFTIEDDAGNVAQTSLISNHELIYNIEKGKDKFFDQVGAYIRVRINNARYLTLSNGAAEMNILVTRSLDNVLAKHMYDNFSYPKMLVITGKEKVHECVFTEECFRFLFCINLNDKLLEEYIQSEKRGNSYYEYICEKAKEIKSEYRKVFDDLKEKFDKKYPFKTPGIEDDKYYIMDLNTLNKTRRMFEDVYPFEITRDLKNKITVACNEISAKTEIKVNFKFDRVKGKTTFKFFIALNDINKDIIEREREKYEKEYKEKYGEMFDDKNILWDFTLLKNAVGGGMIEGIEDREVTVEEMEKEMEEARSKVRSRQKKNDLSEFIAFIGKQRPMDDAVYYRYLEELEGMDGFYDTLLEDTERNGYAVIAAAGWNDILKECSGDNKEDEHYRDILFYVVKTLLGLMLANLGAKKGFPSEIVIEKVNCILREKGKLGLSEFISFMVDKYISAESVSEKGNPEKYLIAVICNSFDNWQIEKRMLARNMKAVSEAEEKAASKRKSAFHNFTERQDTDFKDDESKFMTRHRKNKEQREREMSEEELLIIQTNLAHLEEESGNSESGD